MTLIETIIRKALFENKRRLTEQTEKWTYIGGLRKPILNKVQSIAPTVVKGFELDLSGDSAKNVNDRTIANWLTNITDTNPDINRTPGLNDLGADSKAPSLNKYTGGNFIFIYGKDNRQTRAEKKLIPGSWTDIINVIVLPMDNMIDILTNVNIQKVSINAWKYPSAKGTSYEVARTAGQLGLFGEGIRNPIGQSPLIYIGDLNEQQTMYKELLPIAREMKNTPQPGGDPNRIDDINDAIEKMESFIKDYPDFNALSKAISPKGVSRGRIYVTGPGVQETDMSVYEKWDATDSKQAAELENQGYKDQSAQSDAEEIAKGNTVLDVEEKEYETTLSPAGKITFTGKWNLELQQPVDGTATDSVGNEWDGQWDTNGNFINGVGYKKLSGGAEWRGGIVRGFIKGYGEYKSPNLQFTGTMNVINKQITAVTGTQNEKWESEVPGKWNSFNGDIANGKKVDGELTRYTSESGKTVEYIFTGAFDSNQEPKDGEVIKDGDYANPYGTFANSVFTKN
jgi:hypothetical protein